MSRRRVHPVVPLLALLMLAAGCRQAPDVEQLFAEARAEAAKEAAAGRSQAATPDAVVLRERLRSEIPAQRLAAAQEIAAHRDIPARERAALLIGSLEREIRNPDSRPRREHSYLPATDQARLDLARLCAEVGPDGLAEVRQAAARGGALGQHATLALGFAGDKQAVPALRRLVREGETGAIRMEAALLLGDLGDRAAVPDLVRALADPWKVETTKYRRKQAFYPVREQADGALEKLGVMTERLPGGSYRVR